MAALPSVGKKRMVVAFRYMVAFSVAVMCWLVIEDLLDVRLRVTSMIRNSRAKAIDIVYEPCTKIPPAPVGKAWPEEAFIHDPKIDSLLDIADPLKSRVWVEGQTEVRVGDSVHLQLELYDGRGRKKKRGGDLVRVWIREQALGAAAAAMVVDNGDGTYTAILSALWEGTPEVRAAIISPREVIATVFRRRYMCPPVLMNTAIFKHPSRPTLVEETPCNYDPQVTGYPAMCNFTGENYNSPWYCGVPRSKGLLCHDWAEIADWNLWKTGHDLSLLTPTELELMDLKYKARIIPTNITITVLKDKNGLTRFEAKAKCNAVDLSVTWSRSQPTGYLFNRKWNSRHCSGSPGLFDYSSCLKNTYVMFVGDSTIRQLFDRIKRKMPCEWLTGAGLIGEKNLKHRPAICLNDKANYSLVMEEHTLPFCTRDTPRTYLKTFAAHLNSISTAQRTILVLHGFSHFLNHHSHVFYETLLNMKKGVVDLLKRHPNVFIVIKGPHTFSFATNTDSVMWMPDKYAEVYHDIIYDVFSDLSDRVMYLECQDITIATEQWHIHAEEYVIDALLDRIFGHACKN